MLPVFAQSTQGRPVTCLLRPGQYTTLKEAMFVEMSIRESYIVKLEKKFEYMHILHLIV